MSARIAAVAVVSALAVAGPGSALGARAPGYSNGAYTGLVGQLAPVSYGGAISFAVAKGKITQLRFQVSELCSNFIEVVVKQPPTAMTIPLGSAGGFAYDRTVAGARIELRGMLRGHWATGTLYATLQLAPHTLCTMEKPAAFYAAR